MQSSSLWGQAKKTPIEVALLLAAILLAIIAPRWILLADVDTTILKTGDTVSHLLLADHAARATPGILTYAEHAWYAKKMGRPATHWPGGLYQAARPWVSLFGVHSAWATYATNLCFSLILAVGVIGLGMAAHSLRLGLWAALLTFLCPALMASSLTFNIDYPLVAMTSVGLLVLWHTRGFGRLGATLAFALWCALGVYVKQLYSLLLLVPALWCVATGLLEHRNKHKVLLYFVVAAHTAVLAFIVLENPSWSAYTSIAVDHSLHQTRTGSFGVDPWSLGSLPLNVLFMIAAFPLPLLLLAAPGFVRLHRKISLRTPSVPALWLTALWGGYLLISVPAVKLERYVHPLYPIICLVTAWSVFEWAPRRWRRPALGAVTACYVAVLVLTTYYPTPWFFKEKSHYSWLQSSLSLCEHGEFLGRFELGFLPPSRRQELVRNGHLGPCSITKISRQIGDLASRSAPGFPLALTVHSGGPRRRSKEKRLVWLAVGKTDSPSFFVHWKDIPKTFNEPFNVLVLHIQPLERLPILHGARVLGQHKGVLACGGFRFPYRLSLLSNPAAPQEMPGLPPPLDEPDPGAVPPPPPDAYQVVEALPFPWPIP